MATKLPKKRLDHILLERYPQYSRAQLASWIMQGYVRIDGHPHTKAGTPVPVDAHITLHAPDERFVCRAGYKLEHALTVCSIDVQGEVVLDAGLSTGGFTDCLLQRGAARVYGVDVGYGQVHERIRTDQRVVVMERTNLRTLTHLPEPITFVTLDVSFISVLKVIDAVVSLLAPRARMVVLIKPQFEAGREHVGKGGIVRDPAIHAHVIKEVTQGIIQRGFALQQVVESPITGTDGNREFLAYFTYERTPRV